MRHSPANADCEPKINILEVTIPMKNEVYVVNCCRTAVGSFGGSLKDTPAADLGAVVENGLFEDECEELMKDFFKKLRSR